MDNIIHELVTSIEHDASMRGATTGIRATAVILHRLGYLSGDAALVCAAVLAAGEVDPLVVLAFGAEDKHILAFRDATEAAIETPEGLAAANVLIAQLAAVVAGLEQEQEQYDRAGKAQDEATR